MENNLITIKNDAELSTLLKGVFIGQVGKKDGTTAEYDRIKGGCIKLLLDTCKISKEDYKELEKQQSKLVEYIFDNLSQAISSLRIGKAEFLKISSFME